MTVFLVRPTSLAVSHLSDDKFHLELPMEREQNQLTPPVVFVSYAHQTPEHKQWVKTLASDLRRKGVDACLDEWRVPPGGDFTLFMEEIRTCDRVLLVCTPEYARKANEGEGGVGYERSVVTVELAKRIDTTKFIPLLRDGEKENSIPTFAQSRRFLDFRNGAEYDVVLEELLRTLLNTPRDPEPPLGLNPFAAKPSEILLGTDLELSNRLEKVSTPHVLIERAAVILSRRDMVSWKRMVRSERGKFETSILEWRNSLKQTDFSNETWPKALDRGVKHAEPLIAIALSAIDSEVEPVRDQLGFLDVILSLERWERGGTICVIEMPRAVAFLYHELVGALYVQSRKYHEAIELLKTAIRDEDTLKVKPIYRDHELMGFVRSFSGNCVTTWKYFVEFYDSRPWLKEFFATKREYVDSYRAYNFTASMLELGSYLKNGGNVEGIRERNFWLDVPAIFMHPIENRGSTFDVIVDKALPNSSVLNHIASTTGSSTAALREAWPHWYGALIRSLSGTFDLLSHRMREHVPELPN